MTAWLANFSKASLDARESVADESTEEAAVSKVKSSASNDLNVRVVLVEGGGGGVTAIIALVSGGEETRGEAIIARGGVDLRSAFFDTGEEEAGGEWVQVFEEVTFVLEMDVVEACFFVPVPVEVSIIVSQADFSEVFWDDALEVRFLVEGLISIALL